MERGGIHDHLGGGFSRYSTDQMWLVPHFEKMLYDNALLTLAYLEGYRLTGNRFYQRTARQILDYVRRELTGPEGGFYCGQDADSQGVEGKYYVFSEEEIGRVLGSRKDQEKESSRGPIFRTSFTLRIMNRRTWKWTRSAAASTNTG